MNLADQAAHAIVLASRYFGVDPLQVPDDQIGLTQINQMRARNTAAALLAGLPDWTRPMACRALGISASLAEFLSLFRDQACEGRLKWLSPAEFGVLRDRLRATVSEPAVPAGFPPACEPAEFPGSGGPPRPKAAQRPDTGQTEPCNREERFGLLDIVYGIEQPEPAEAAAE